MRPRKIALADRKLFQEFLGLKCHQLSVYTFANIYIWRGLFDISWQVIDDNLCVIFRDKFSCFLYLPPLGMRLSPKALEWSFGIMDKRNINSAISRIENIEADQVIDFEKSGYRIVDKAGEYLCLRKSLAELKGDSFKSKRAAVNFFTKHHDPRYLEYSGRYKSACLGLYQRWSGQRSGVNNDPVYQGMLKDSLVCLATVFSDYQKLGLAARIVEINGQVQAFTAGFAINPETFCVLYEFSDLSFKGLSQYIFRSLCQELQEYKYINIMDDSGLENLKKVKESYRPLRLIQSFIAGRKNG
jgi:uncharacterized protein